jgi:hypothetical protein
VLSKKTASWLGSTEQLCPSSLSRRPSPTALPTYGQISSGGESLAYSSPFAISKFRIHRVWHSSCLITSVIRNYQLENAGGGGSAASDVCSWDTGTGEIATVFSEYREELEWLADFLTGNHAIAAACFTDACAQAGAESPGFQGWLLKWARLATIRSAVQIQQRRIAELSSTYNRRPCIHEGHPALSADCIEFLVTQSDVVTRMDALCRCVLVICGIEKHSAAEAGILLALDRTTVEGAYCAALQLLEVISCEELLQQNDFVAVCN